VRTQQVDAERKQRDPDHAEEQVPGHLAGEQTAGRRRNDRRRGHPEEDPPVDSPRADMCDGRRQRRGRRDADVRTRAGGRARRRQDDHRQADVAENEADETSCDGCDEAPECDRDEEKRVQALEYPA
jgi:hypothetical protein